MQGKSAGTYTHTRAVRTRTGAEAPDDRESINEQGPPEEANVTKQTRRRPQANVFAGRQGGEGKPSAAKHGGLSGENVNGSAGKGPVRRPRAWRAPRGEGRAGHPGSRAHSRAVNGDRTRAKKQRST
jgi:hypothetical protein